MRRPRFPIAEMMAFVLAVAVNLAVMRAFEGDSAESLPHLFFACGVMPMASILALVGLLSTPNLVRGGRLSPYVFGFEASGWLAVFAFVTSYALAPSALLAGTAWIGDWTRPVLVPLFEGQTELGSHVRGTGSRSGHLFASGAGHRARRRLAGRKGWADGAIRAWRHRFECAYARNRERSFRASRVGGAEGRRRGLLARIIGHGRSEFGKGCHQRLTQWAV